jgi:hypothetical protein
VAELAIERWVTPEEIAMKVVIKTLFIPILMALLAVPAAAMDFAYELLATKDVSDPGLTEVDEVVDALIAAAKKMPGLQVAIGTHGVDRLTYYEDLNMDGSPEEVGRMVEISFPLDTAVLAVNGPRHGVPFPLGGIGVLTHGDQIQVHASVPETRIRVYFRDRDLESREDLEALGELYRERIEHLVENALGGQGFTIMTTGEEPVLNEDAIGYIETNIVGVPLTNYDYVAPAATLPKGMTVKEVVEAFENALDGDPTDSDVIGVAHGALQSAFITAVMATGDDDYDLINDLLWSAQQDDGVWHTGQALEEWVLLRVLKIAGNVYMIELCQPFFAGAALSVPAFYHYLELPCGLVVWQQGPHVQIAQYNPLVVFPFFFSDALGPICDNPAMIGMCNVFQVFPLVAFNEVASIINGVLGDEYIGLYDVPPLPIVP